jgi:uncharacterized membrane protein
MKTIPEIRPILKLKLTKTDYFLEAVALSGLLSIWTLAAISFHSLPEIIPAHFNSTGNVDEWAAKTSVFILPAICIVLFVGLTFLNKFPHVFNYPSKVTAENAQILYTKGTRIVRIVKVLTAILFLFIEFQICKPEADAKLPTLLLILIFSIPVLLPIALAFTFTKYFDTNKKGS